MDGMLDLIEANWLVFGAVVVLALLIAWLVWGRGTREERVRYQAPDVLDEGAAPAERNSLLVDAPPAVSFTAAPIAGFAPDIMGGMGELIAAATAQEIVGPHPSAPDAADQPDAHDDLTRIKGIGPKLVRMLGELGIHRYEQIAAWSDEDIARIDPQLGPFQGRIERDNWVDQCRYLAVGDIPGYEAKYGKL
jgi:predicted flap endonuclease-1-like 5' DNA nuclease